MFRIFYFIAIITLASFIGQSKSFGIVNQCFLKNPDTSLSGIRLREGSSVSLVLGQNIKLEGDSTHAFYSKGKDQILRMTVHAGDGKNQVSIISVKYAGRYDQKYQLCSIERFVTEKGIRLGISKLDVIEKLGDCFSYYSDKGLESICYRLESPQDSKKKLLERNNMPIYYAVYYFKNNRLLEFEFGFEYP